MNELQARASEKAKRRRADMGELLRSKGFLWVASTNNVMGGWQQAGNVIRLEAEDKWMCEDREFWEDNEEVAKLVYKDIKKPNGEEWEYGDRRQELVFIGQVILLLILVNTQQNRLSRGFQSLLDTRKVGWWPMRF